MSETTGADGGDGLRSGVSGGGGEGEERISMRGRGRESSERGVGEVGDE